ncbi:unnamed protein product [Effrenium voratum]|nr:unnamed protein product [Effrenium voratum]
MSVLESEKLVVQNFLTKPLLIDGYKWDMRVYVLLTSVSPLTVYLFTDGLARFCTDLYEVPGEENLDVREMHLTNFSINWESGAFEDTEDAGTGSKRSLRTVLESLDDGRAIWQQIATCVKKTLLAIAPKMQDNYDRYFGRSREGGASACFELLGFDFILTEDRRLYLLEVNSAPSLSTPTCLDEEIKLAVLAEAFRLLCLDGSEKARHLERQQQRLAARCTEHLARREELARQKAEHLRSKVGFARSLGKSTPSARKSGVWKEDTPLVEESGCPRKAIPGLVSFLEDSTDSEMASEVPFKRNMIFQTLSTGLLDGGGVDGTLLRLPVSGPPCQQELRADYACGGGCCRDLAGDPGWRREAGQRLDRGPAAEPASRGESSRAQAAKGQQPACDDTQGKAELNTGMPEPAKGRASYESCTGGILTASGEMHPGMCQKIRFWLGPEHRGLQQKGSTEDATF